MKKRKCDICGNKSTLVSGSISGYTFCSAHSLDERRSYLSEKWNSYWKKISKEERKR